MVDVEQASSSDEGPPRVLGGDEHVPAVIVSDVNISYRVFGAGSAAKMNAGGRWGKAMNKARTQVGTREIHAVKDVSFVAYRGESIGVIGRNGSGKSTMLRSVAGLIPPTSGSIYLNGGAALLGVNAVLMRNLTGARNIMIGGQALGLSRRQLLDKFDEIVAFADIGDFINLPMSSYSSGMAARLRFAISTAVVPDILVVDEALATGDAQFQARATERIAKIRESAGTIFIVSHTASQVKSLCSRVLWMDAGHLIMDGAPKDVMPAYRAVYGPPLPVRRRRGKSTRSSRATPGQAGVEPMTERGSDHQERPPSET
ncbi:MAG: ABC transporter ATP-binding protein [Ornithinimicrobium sp.]